MLDPADMADMPPLSDENAEIDNGSSYAQVDTFELCPRKWGFRWVAGDKRKNKFASRGIDTHDLIKKWLRGRVLPSGMTVEGKLAQAILLHLPEPQSVDPANVELETIFQIAGTSFFMGIDLWMPTGFDHPRVFDHKTTTDLKWALSPDLFENDVQATLYAAWALVKTNASKVEVQWTYGQTKNAPEPGVMSNWQPKVLPVVSTLTAAQCRDRLGRTIETARAIREIRESGVKNPLEMPYDARGCGKFGGCAYKDLCKLTPEMQFESLVAQRAIKSKQQEQESKMAIVGDAKSLAERMEARKANGAAGAAAPAINPPPAPAQAAPAAPAGGLAARMAARQAGQAPAQAVQAAPEAPAVQEEPKRGRGRPPKAAAAAEPAYVGGTLPADLVEAWVANLQAQTGSAQTERWVKFAQGALGAIIANVDPTEAVDVTNAAEFAGLAVAYADAMAAELNKRFKG